MSKTKTSTQVPKLRFPGFSEAWEVSRINELVEQEVIAKPMDGNHGNIHPKASDFVPEGIAFVMANDFLNGRVNLQGATRITKDQADKLQKGFSVTGDVLLTHKGTIGLTAIVPALEDDYIMLTPQVTYYRVLRHDRLNNLFLRACFDAPTFQEHLSLLGAGGTRPYVGITEQRSLLIAFPLNVAEQQKIAAFLTAVDGRIEQLSRKKALLEEYKKGVMQQLFTQTLRFQDDHGHDFPDWEEQTLKSICSTFKGGNGITADEVQDSGIYPVYGGNGLRGYTDRFTHEGEFVLIGRQGALCGNINRASGKSYISEHAIAVAGNHLASTDWLEHRLDHMKLNRLSESSAQPGLAVNKLEKLKLLVPSLPEQTKIAGILSALDGKIGAVGEQMRQTQAWKKGLLQQMFV